MQYLTKKKEKMCGPKHPPSKEQLYRSISISMSEKLHW